MSLQVKDGDLFANAHPSCLIVHGCNAQGKMASGFAKELRKRFPEAYTVYKRAYDKQGLQLGSINGYTNEKRLTVVNAITQEFYGREPGRVYVSYPAVGQALTQVANHVKKSCFPDYPVHLPFIGGGLAGGDHEQLMTIFEEVFKDINATLWLH